MSDHFASTHLCPKELLFALVLCLLNISPVLAQCVSTATPSCKVYDTCFEATCKCESSLFPYFISYGKKYCERFLASTNWSSSGASWRDKTLVCLQEKIVLMLPTNALPCDCKALKAAAFQIHVACYTQPNASVCDLGLGDWITIYKIIDNHDLFADPDGRAQMLAVARICGSNHPDGPLKDIFNKIINALK